MSGPAKRNKDRLLPVTLSPCHVVTLLLLLAGCHHAVPPAPPVHVEPRVRLVKPELRSISRLVGQPGYIYAYEQTSIYPRVTGYVQVWHVDIGDPLEKDQEMARLYVPELEAQLAQMKAQVELDEEQVKVAEQAVDVASAQVEEARANVKKFQASVQRWQSQVQRLTDLAVNDRVIDQQVLDESQKQLKAETAAREAAQATETAGKAALAKTRADVRAARARARVSRAEEQRLAALVGYTHITAPYDGIVVDRTVNTGDYVQPGTGNQSDPGGSPTPSSSRLPLYVVARTDKVRVYVDVPELDASAVTRGTPARVRIQALGDAEVNAAVTRTSWSLRPQSRTLRAEIDLPNPDARLLPGMYAYGQVLIDRSNVRALPMEAVTEIGNQPCCYLYVGGKAVRTALQTGIDDGKWIEVTKKRVKGKWVDLTGAEEVIVGDLSEVSDGVPVQVEPGH
jgi:multidrug efflux pump subunit AcrA (membrane-fusion protein)